MEFAVVENSHFDSDGTVVVVVLAWSSDCLNVPGFCSFVVWMHSARSCFLIVVSALALVSNATNRYFSCCLVVISIPADNPDFLQTPSMSKSGMVIYDVMMMKV